MNMKYLARMHADVQDAKDKFNGRFDSKGYLQIDKFRCAGKREFLHKMKLSVKYTPIRVTITTRYPFVKPSIVFLDRHIKAQGIAPSGLYTDNIAWSPRMDISDFVDCVRHELLTAPCVEESEEEEESESENDIG